ncbi:MAG: hypothetical protein Q7U38_04905, partial [Methylobacter sp.]|nr:hypothetical protein [Methylobacter sp.]
MIKNFKNNDFSPLILTSLLWAYSSLSYAEVDCGENPPSDTTRVQCLNGKWYQLTYDSDPTWGGWSGSSCKIGGTSNCTQNNEIYYPPTPTPEPTPTPTPT